MASIQAIGAVSEFSADLYDVSEKKYNSNTFKGAYEITALLGDMPLDSIMQMLCVVNHVFNGEKLKLEDIQIYDFDQTELKQSIEEERTEKTYAALSEIQEQQEVHNTLALEQTLMNIVRKGDTAALREWIDKAPAVRGGILASNELRQLKKHLYCYCHPNFT